MFFSLRLKQGYIKKPTRRPTKTSKALRETNENKMSFEASTPPRKMSHECRPSKRELWLKWKADQIFHQSPSIFRHKLASVVSGRLWLFCAFEAGECLANSCKNPRNPSTTVGKPTSEATYGIPQLQTSCEALLRTQFRKKDSNQRSSPKTTHFEKKNIQKKRDVFSCYMSPKKTSPKSWWIIIILKPKRWSPEKRWYEPRKLRG